MNKIFNLVKKELDKIFRSPRSIITNFILPGILIYLVYAIMGNIMSSNITSKQNTTYKIGIANTSQAFVSRYNTYNAMLEQAGKNKIKFDFIEIDYGMDNFDRIASFDKITNPSDKEKEVYNEINSDIINKKYDAIICFNSQFDDKYQVNNQLDKAKVSIFGKKSYENSSYAMNMLNTLLDSMQKNIIASTRVDFSTKTEISTTMLASMVPMFLIIFVFSSGMSVCADSIAGEKERGTISTLLMTPIKRSHILFGKIISLVIITILAAIGPFIAVIASIPKLMESSGLSFNIGFALSATSIAQIFLIVVVTALFATSIYLLFSTIAKSVKEATMFAAPVSMIAIVLATLATSLDVGTSIGLYFIPFMNIALALNGAIMSTITVGQILATVFSTLLYCIILIFISIKLFNSEKILYAK